MVTNTGCLVLLLSILKQHLHKLIYVQGPISILQIHVLILKNHNPVLPCQPLSWTRPLHPWWGLFPGSPSLSSAPSRTPAHPCFGQKSEKPLSQRRNKKKFFLLKVRQMITTRSCFFYFDDFPWKPPCNSNWCNYSQLEIFSSGI